MNQALPGIFQLYSQRRSDVVYVGLFRVSRAAMRTREQNKSREQGFTFSPSSFLFFLLLLLVPSHQYGTQTRRRRFRWVWWIRGSPWLWEQLGCEVRRSLTRFHLSVDRHVQPQFLPTSGSRRPRRSRRQRQPRFTPLYSLPVLVDTAARRPRPRKRSRRHLLRGSRVDLAPADS